MKIGDKVVLKESFSLPNIKGTLLSSLPIAGPRQFLVRIDYKDLIYIILKESDFIRTPGKEGIQFLFPFFCKEEGSCGNIISVLPNSRYLCEFDGPFCNIELSEDQIMEWSPKTGIFGLLDSIRLIDDIPEYSLKKGMEGVIIVVYFQPHLAYEVEFCLVQGENTEFREAALLPHHLELVK